MVFSSIICFPHWSASCHSDDQTSRKSPEGQEETLLLHQSLILKELKSKCIYSLLEVLETSRSCMKIYFTLCPRRVPEQNSSNLTRHLKSVFCQSPQGSSRPSE